MAKTIPNPNQRSISISVDVRKRFSAICEANRWVKGLTADAVIDWWTRLSLDAQQAIRSFNNEEMMQNSLMREALASSLEAIAADIRGKARIADLRTNKGHGNNATPKGRSAS